MKGKAGKYLLIRFFYAYLLEASANLTLFKPLLAGIFKPKKKKKKKRLVKLLKMQEIVVQGKRLNFSQTKISNALALTDLHVGLMDMCGMRSRKVNRCPNKSFDKLWLQDHHVVYKVISRQLTMIACIAKFTNFAILRRAV